jgi:Helix-turn-helix domain
MAGHARIHPHRGTEGARRASDSARAPLLQAFVAAFDEADETGRREVAGRLRPYLVDPPSLLLNSEEKARQLGLHPDTLVRMARAGRVPSARKIGREWRFLAGACEVLPPPATPPLRLPSAPRERRAVRARPSIAAIRGR